MLELTGRLLGLDGIRRWDPSLFYYTILLPRLTVTRISFLLVTTIDCYMDFIPSCYHDLSPRLTITQILFLAVTTILCPRFYYYTDFIPYCHCLKDHELPSRMTAFCCLKNTILPIKVMTAVSCYFSPRF
jgi:hypothetical protein